MSPIVSVPLSPDTPLSAPMFAAVRLRTLVLLRWVAVAGQTATVLVVQYGFGFDLPLALCLAVIAASIVFNIGLTLRLRLSRLAQPRETLAQLVFDVAQLAAILGLTGGLANPFALILVAPVVTGAATLPWRSSLPLALFAIACTALMAAFALPLPWAGETALSLPNVYVFGIWTSLIIAMAFTGLTAWRASAETARASRALAATQAVLAREQRLAAIGGIAAAAAHELGTPLATIQLVAKEMARGLPEDGVMAEDARLLIQQTERCRDILGQLSQRGDEVDAGVAQAEIEALLQEIVEPFRGLGADVEVILDGEGRPPDLKRTPEIIYGLGNLVENAVDFAETRVSVIGRWDDNQVHVTVQDDGAGFDPDVLAKLGEPYVSTREDAEDAGGMGLGVFIADTLLARIGGKVDFDNAPEGGARVCTLWRRADIEAPPPSPHGL